MQAEAILVLITQATITAEMVIAACHACLMIPETACENGNRLLDRRTIVPTQEKKFKGYFEKLVEEVCGINL